MCVTDGSRRILDQAIDEYATVCQQQGIPVCDWRDITDLGTLCSISYDK